MAYPKTRMRKAECQRCGYTIRLARSWIAEGLPTCVCGGRMTCEKPVDQALVPPRGVMRAISGV